MPSNDVLLKICEMKVIIPALNFGDVVKTLRIFRNSCLAMLKDEYKTMPQDKMDDRIGIGMNEMIFNISSYDDRLAKPVNHLCKLLSNPRVLKLTLRDVQRIWKKLYGEINFDDLLMTQTLFNYKNGLSVFVDKNINTLRSFHQNTRDSNDRNRKNRDKLKKELTRTLSSEEIYLDSIDEILDTLFPDFKEKNSMMNFFYKDNMAMYQLVCSSEPTDYWIRLAHEELVEDDISDKDILTGINKWNRNYKTKAYKEMDMAKALLSDEKIFDKVRQFKKMIDFEVLLKMSSEQFAVELNRDGHKAGKNNGDSVETFWLLLPDVRQDKWLNWLIAETRKAMQISFKYANTLYYYWTNHEDNYRPDIRIKTIEIAKESFENKPDLLVKALDSDFPYILTHFIQLYSDPKYGGTKITGKDWIWFAQTLLDAGKLNNQTMIPQIAIFLSNGKNTHDNREWKWTGEFNEDFARDMFGDKFDKLMQLLAEKIDISGFSEEAQAMIKAAQNFARKYLESKNQN